VREPSKQGAACASVLAAASLWGILGLWNRALTAGGVSPMGIVAMRNLGGMVLLCTIYAVRDRSVFRVKWPHLKYFFGTGTLSMVLFACCYFTCQQMCSLAVASVLLYTAPAFVVLLSALVWREPVTGRKLLALTLTLLGCVMVCGLLDGELTATPLGILVGVGSGFFFALYSVFGRCATAHYSSLTVTVWTFIFAGASSLLLVRPGDLAALTASPSMVLLALGQMTVSTVIPFLLYTWGLARLDPGRASILAAWEPVVAALTGVLVFGEQMSGIAVLGVVCVLAGVWILR